MRAVTGFTQSFFTVQIHILESLYEPYGDERVVIDAIDSIARASTRDDHGDATRFSETSTRRDTKVLANARSMATAFGTARERERR